ncbi:unnamed protein product [Schistosoma turkestanicum]|nr:unnamed protein product [Schistosoma turkestanicum]
MLETKELTSSSEEDGEGIQKIVNIYEICNNWANYDMDMTSNNTSIHSNHNHTTDNGTSSSISSTSTMTSQWTINDILPAYLTENNTSMNNHNIMNTTTSIVSSINNKNVLTSTTTTNTTSTTTTTNSNHINLYAPAYSNHIHLPSIESVRQCTPAHHQHGHQDHEDQEFHNDLNQTNLYSTSYYHCYDHDHHLHYWPSDEEPNEYVRNLYKSEHFLSRITDETCDQSDSQQIHLDINQSRRINHCSPTTTTTTTTTIEPNSTNIVKCQVSTLNSPSSIVNLNQIHQYTWITCNEIQVNSNNSTESIKESKDNSSLPPIQHQQHQQQHLWDIKDLKLPKVTYYDLYELWPTGHCRRVYASTCERARRHQSGWAMRNTNNHNPQVLKKSCLGVLECTANCMVQGKPLSLRPAICDKARKKQCNRQCITPGCKGRLILRNCRGHSGYPVTHFWRFANGAVYFEAKGEHDHNRPSLKTFGLSDSETTMVNHVITGTKPITTTAAAVTMTTVTTPTSTTTTTTSAMDSLTTTITPTTTTAVVALTDNAGNFNVQCIEHLTPHFDNCRQHQHQQQPLNHDGGQFVAQTDQSMMFQQNLNFNLSISNNCDNNNSKEFENPPLLLFRQLKQNGKKRANNGRRRKRLNHENKLTSTYFKKQQKCENYLKFSPTESTGVDMKRNRKNQLNTPLTNDNNTSQQYHSQPFYHNDTINSNNNNYNYYDDCSMNIDQHHHQHHRSMFNDQSMNSMCSTSNSSTSSSVLQIATTNHQQQHPPYYHHYYYYYSLPLKKNAENDFFSQSNSLNNNNYVTPTSGHGMSTMHYYSPNWQLSPSSLSVYSTCSSSSSSSTSSLCSCSSLSSSTSSTCYQTTPYYIHVNSNESYFISTNNHNYCPSQLNTYSRCHGDDEYYYYFQPVFFNSTCDEDDDEIYENVSHHHHSHSTPLQQPQSMNANHDQYPQNNDNYYCNYYSHHSNPWLTMSDHVITNTTHNNNTTYSTKSINHYPMDCFQSNSQLYYQEQATTPPPSLPLPSQQQQGQLTVQCSITENIDQYTPIRKQLMQVSSSSNNDAHCDLSNSAINYYYPLVLNSSSMHCLQEQHEFAKEFSREDGLHEGGEQDDDQEDGEDEEEGVEEHFDDDSHQYDHHYHEQPQHQHQPHNEFIIDQNLFKTTTDWSNNNVYYLNNSSTVSIKQPGQFEQDFMVENGGGGSGSSNQYCFEECLVGTTTGGDTTTLTTTTSTATDTTNNSSNHQHEYSTNQNCPSEFDNSLFNYYFIVNQQQPVSLDN